jgi:predicted nucleotidyltransferase
MHPALQMFLDKVRGLRDQVTALYLFGSRARGDLRPDSDFDVLVILPERKQARVDQFYDAVLDVNLETGLLISLAAIPTPFLANVAAEGARLGLDD